MKGILLFISLLLTRAYGISQKSFVSGQINYFEARSQSPLDAEWDIPKTSFCQRGNPPITSIMFTLESSELLEISNFNFSIPKDANITSIIVTLSVSVTGITLLGTRESEVALFKDRGDIKWDTPIYPYSQQIGWTVQNMEISYPLNTSDPFWGTDWSPLDVNSPEFGVALVISNGMNTEIASIYCISVEIEYRPNITSESAPPFSSLIPRNNTDSYESVITSSDKSNQTDGGFTLDENTQKSGTNELIVEQSTNNSIFGMTLTNVTSIAILVGIFAFFILLITVTCLLLIRLKIKKKKEIPKKDPESLSDKIEKLNEFIVLSPKNGMDKEPDDLSIIGVSVKDGAMGFRNDKPIFRGEYKGFGVACQEIPPLIRDTLRFKQEMRKIKDQRHTNIVTYLGIFDTEKISYMITDTTELVTLREYLIDKREKCLGLLDICSILDNVVDGMIFLDSKRIIHGNLCAQNILVNPYAKDLISFKISDYGFSKKDNQTILLKNNEFPIRQSPPEVLKYGEYSQYSDVWSFGILTWEVVTHGEIPYATMEISQVTGFICGGGSPTVPNFCDGTMKAFMMNCWAVEPEARPDFNLVSQWISQIRTSIPTRQKSTFNRDESEKIRKSNHKSLVSEQNSHSKGQSTKKNTGIVSSLDKTPEIEKRTEEEGEEEEEKEKEKELGYKRSSDDTEYLRPRRSSQAIDLFQEIEKMLSTEEGSFTNSLEKKGESPISGIVPYSVGTEIPDVIRGKKK
jgi:hypothetical protein